jgi:hypothetical protein
VLGPRHPDVLGSLNNLAGLFHLKGRYDEAEPLYRKALQGRCEVLGRRHPQTLIGANNLALLYHIRAASARPSRSFLLYPRTPPAADA